MRSLHNSYHRKTTNSRKKPTNIATSYFCWIISFFYLYYDVTWYFFGYTYNANNLHIIFLCQIKLVWWQQKQCIKMKDDALYLRKRREKETPLQYFIGKLDLRGKRGTTRKKKRLLVAIFCVIDFFCCSILVNVLGEVLPRFCIMLRKPFSA